MSSINNPLEKLKKMQAVYTQQVNHSEKKRMTLGIFAFEYPVADKKSVIEKILKNILETKPCIVTGLDYYEKKVAMDSEIGPVINAYLEERKSAYDQVRNRNNF